MAKHEGVEKLNELIKGIKIAMLTTVDADGSLRSRPLYTQEAEPGGDLWFFIDADSAKVDEIAKDARVNVSYAAPDDQRYVSLSGTAQVLHDRARMKELWSPVAKGWYPEGPEDPRLALLRVTVEKAEYWDTPSGKMVQLAGFLKAVVTGERLEYAGENEKVELAGTEKS